MLTNHLQVYFTPPTNEPDKDNKMKMWISESWKWTWFTDWEAIQPPNINFTGHVLFNVHEDTMGQMGW